MIGRSWRRLFGPRAQSMQRLEDEISRLRSQLAAQGQLVEAIHHRAALLEDINHRLVMATTGRQGAARAVGRDPRGEPVRLPTPANPTVTIVIPAHGQLDLTLHCLRSIAQAHTETSFDVIVVDDASPRRFAEELGRIPGLRLLRLDENQGFLRACNAGVATVSAPFAVLLNNDTEVHDGWLDALVERACSDRRIAIVGSMLLFADGTLQEAGGIVFADGRAWNYGRHAAAEEFAYCWPRDVDYCSAACILVRSDFWKDVGGFDERFAPAYYEDADLAFEAREAGWRVVYEPRAKVTHFEGGSHGTDASTGIKAYQVRNQAVFSEKWAHRLPEQLAHDPDLLFLARDTRRGGHVLVVDHYVPESDRDSGSLRMRMLLELLVAEGFVVHFVSDNLHGSEPYTSELQDMGIEVVRGRVDPADVIRAIAPDLALAILSRPGVAWRYIPWIREHGAGVPIVFDMVDAHGLRERRRAERLRRPQLEQVASTWDQMEAALARSCDLTIAVSETDARHLCQIAGPVPYVVLPNIHAPTPPSPGHEARSGLLFVGGFRHHPNVQAALDLVDEIVPRVERILGRPVPTMLVGPDAPPEVNALASSTVTVSGWVKDLEPLYNRSRVLVAPLSFGAGVKGKITHSMMAGLPVVTTSVGLEGLEMEPGEHLLVADDLDELAELTAWLLNDDAAWERLSHAGRQRAEELFGLATARARLRGMLQQLGVAPPARVPTGTPRGAMDRGRTDEHR